MASTCSAVRVMPASRETRTEAEGWSELEEKSDLLGDHDVYHGGAHTVYGLDGLFELVGDGLLVLDLLLEL